MSTTRERELPDGGRSSDALFSVEQHGIDIVGSDERKGRPSELFWMWAGTNLNVYYVVNGALLISFGLSFVQSLLAIAVGSLSFLLVGLASLQGPETGTATFAVSRAAYGPNGGRGLSVFNWLTCIGFESSGVSLIVLAALALLSKAGVGSSPGLKAVLIVVAAAVVMAIPLYGHATVLVLQRWLAWLAVPLFVIMAIIVAPKVHLGALSKGGSWAEIMIGIALIVTGGGLSWANCASDYSRYLPAGSDKKAIFWYSSLGGLLPSLLLAALGAAIASVVKTASDPIAGLPGALPGGVLVPYLLFLVVSTVCGNGVLLYSSGLTLQAIGLRLRRWQCVLADGVVCTAVAFVVVFNSTFNHYYGDFLGLLGVWLAPWIAVYVVDWLLRRGHYDAQSLVAGRGARYWYDGGIHLPGVLAQAFGMVAAALWLNSTTFIGPLSSRTHDSDFSVFAGMLVAGLTYWLLTRRSVSAEGQRSADDARASGEDRMRASA